MNKIRTHIGILDRFVEEATATHFYLNEDDWDPSTAEDCREAFKFLVEELEREQPDQHGSIVLVSAAAKALLNDEPPPNCIYEKIGYIPSWPTEKFKELAAVLWSVMEPFLEPGDIPDDAEIIMDWNPGTDPSILSAPLSPLNDD